MSAPFDPYHKWLGILPEEQPPNYYRLLGVALFEADPQVIQGAAERQIVHVSGHRLGQWSALAQRVLNELAVAKVSLLQPETKAEYDAHLRQRMTAASAAQFELPADDPPDPLTQPGPAAVATLPPVIPPPVPISVLPPPIVPPPVAEPAGRLDWPPTATAPSPIAVGTAAARTAGRPVFLNGVLLVVLVSAAAAIGGAVFLAVVLRQIDKSHSPADALPATSAALDRDAAENSAGDAAAVTSTGEDSGSAHVAKHHKPPAETEADSTTTGADAPPEHQMASAPGERETDAGDQAAVPELPLVYREEGVILQVAISPDGREAVSVAQLRPPAMPNPVRFWTMEDGTQISRELKLPPDVTATSYSASGHELFVGTASGKASVISLETGEVLAIGRGAGPLTTAIATGNGAFLFVRPGQLAIEGWDRGHNVLRVACDSLQVSPSCLAISANNTSMLTASPSQKAPDRKVSDRKASDGGPRAAGGATVQLWEVQPKATAGGAANERVYRATLKLDLTSGVGGLSSLALGPDARQAFFAGSGGEIHVWDLERGVEARTLSGHTAAVTSMSLSEDGSRLVSGSADRTVRAWTVAEGIELMRYDGHTQAVRSVAITPNGRMAISGAGDGQVRIWRLPIARAAEQATVAAADAKAPTTGIFDPAPAIAAPAARLVGAEVRALARSPTGSALQRATSDMKKLFRLEFAAAKDPQSKLELAGMLLSESGNYPPPYRFAMLDEARSLAAGGGDLGLSQSAIRALVEQFEIDSSQLTAETLEQLSHQPLPAEVRQQLAVASLAAAEESLAAEKYATARRLLAIAVAAARKGNDTRLALQIADRTTEAAESQKSYERFTAAQKVLKATPDDSAARLAVGKYVCFVRQDWTAGLPHLASGDNPALQEVARLELAGPAEPADELKLADAWWKLAQGAKGKDRSDFFARSRHWYQAVLPNLTGLTETRVAQRLEDLDAQDVARARGR